MFGFVRFVANAGGVEQRVDAGRIGGVGRTGAVKDALQLCDLIV